LDLFRLTLEAKLIFLKKSALAYKQHITPWFVGLLVHGSAMKGDIILGCSDVDYPANTIALHKGMANTLLSPDFATE